MEKYRDNDPGKEQTAYDRLSDESTFAAASGWGCRNHGLCVGQVQTTCAEKGECHVLIGAIPMILSRKG